MGNGLLANFITKRDKICKRTVPQLNRHAMKTYGRGETKLHAFLISAPDESLRSRSRSGRSVQEEISAVSIGHELGWAPELVWAMWREEKSLPVSRIELRSFRLYSHVTN